MATPAFHRPLMVAAALRDFDGQWPIIDDTLFHKCHETTYYVLNLVP